MSAARLMRKMALVYFVVLLIGVTVLEAENIILLGITFEELLPYNIPGVAAGSAIIYLTLMIITYFRLRRVFPLINGSDKTDAPRLLARLFRLPYELFWGMIWLCILFSLFFHFFEFVKDGYDFMSMTKEVGDALLQSLLGEQALALTLAILIFTAVRNALRPALLNLEMFEMEGSRKTTFFYPLVLTFFSGFLITLFNVFRYVLEVQIYGDRFNLPFLAGVTLFYFAFSACLMFFVIREFKLELQVVIQGIRSLVHVDRAKLRSKIPLISQDESGQLAVAFNKMQDRLTRENEEMERELQLAYNVQHRLLPAEYQEIGGCRIAALCRPDKEIGGDLYDVVVLDDARFAVLIGDVSGKGLPAALMMSATMVLFRAEVRRGGDAGEVLARLNKEMCETIRESMYVTLGLAVIDSVNQTIEYASAGHVSPYLMRPRGMEQLDVPSLPVGISPDETYRSVHLTFEKDDRLVMYTDGLIESMDESGEMFGFEQFELTLQQMETSRPLPERLKAMAEQVPPSAAAKYQDDRTMVVIEMSAGRAV